MHRTGALFEKPFRRVLVDSEVYFSRLVSYIHQNPAQHGIINDFRKYSHSSYQSHLAKGQPSLGERKLSVGSEAKKTMSNFMKKFK